MANYKTKKVKSSEPEYEVKGEVTTIRATSRLSIKVKDNFYTVEYSEERLIPAITGSIIEEERKALWNDVNNEVDNQIQDIYAMYK